MVSGHGLRREYRLAPIVGAAFLVATTVGCAVTKEEHAEGAVAKEETGPMVDLMLEFASLVRQGTQFLCRCHQELVDEYPECPDSVFTVPPHVFATEMATCMLDEERSSDIDWETHRASFDFLSDKWNEANSCLRNMNCSGARDIPEPCVEALTIDAGAEVPEAVEGDMIFPFGMMAANSPGWSLMIECYIETTEVMDGVRDNF